MTKSILDRIKRYSCKKPQSKYSQNPELIVLNHVIQLTCWHTGPLNFLEVQQPVKKHQEFLTENLVDILMLEIELLDFGIPPA